MFEHIRKTVLLEIARSLFVDHHIPELRLVLGQNCKKVQTCTGLHSSTIEELFLLFSASTLLYYSVNRACKPQSRYFRMQQCKQQPMAANGKR